MSYHHYYYYSYNNDNVSVTIIDIIIVMMMIVICVSTIIITRQFKTCTPWALKAREQAARKAVALDLHIQTSPPPVVGHETLRDLLGNKEIKGEESWGFWPGL